jgi:hypothetical protein
LHCWAAARAYLTRLFQTSLPVSLALLACSGCEESPQRTVRAIVFETHGTVSIQSDRYSPELPMPSNASLPVGTIIRTESESGASIALLPNALVQLAETTKLEILALTITKDGNETEDPMRDRLAHVKLWRGAIFLFHERNDTARAELRITTSQGEAMTGAAALCKLEAGNHHARLTSVSGQILFRQNESAKAEQVPPGNVAEWNSGIATLVSVVTDRPGQDAVNEAIEVERKVRALRRAARNILPR